MIEVLSTWTGPGRSPKVTVHHFRGNDPVEAGAAASSVRALWDLLNGAIHSSYSVQVEGEMRVLDPATGALEDIVNIIPPNVVNGEAGGQPVADATQVLLQWRTGLIVNGRQLRGRTFVPGFTANVLNNGNLAPATVADINTNLAAWLVAEPGIAVWHRPGPSGPGTDALVTAATVWSELAVQRRRRG